VADGDPSQTLDVYLPTGSAGPYPVLLALHGGGADKQDMSRLALRFAKLGYVTLALNFRDMPGHTYPAPVQDAFCALAWTFANAETYNLDTGRIVAVGHSVGGTLAAMLAAVDEPARYLQDCPQQLPGGSLLQGAVAFTGIFDYMNFSSTSYFHDYLNGSPSQTPETWAEASVVTWIDGSEPPFLLIHGEVDDNIPPENSTDFAAALEQAGVAATVLIVPGARHNDIINHAQSFEALENFLQTLNAAPVISGLSDQSIADGERFPAFKLDDYVTDSDHADREITWSFAGNVELEPRIVNVKGEFSVQVPDADWTGSETILLTACDPGGLCDAVDVVFSVNYENDAPLLRVQNQAVLPGDSFTAIALGEHVQDVDHAPAEITWSFAGGEELDLVVADGVLTVRASDETWRGSETVQLRACDAGGACGSQEVTFTVLDESDLVVTYVGNEGFLIISAGKKILVDALHRSRMSPEIMALLENAQPPFDGVDLILVTHNHADHFDPEMVGQHMTNNPEALFVSTYQAVADLQAEYAGWDEIQERVTSVRLEPQGSLQQTINGVPLEMIELPHGDPGLQPPHNIGFLITLGEHKLLHTGDLVPASVDLPYLQAYDLPSKQIDVLFMAHLMLLDQSYHDLLEQAFPTRYLIPMHLDPARDRLNYNTISEYFPEAITFRAELASWLMPDKDF
jgi:acetyl esterase/lipase/L-ascorbate metabolism protein UlaG (beta-lactamase superfamily)